jgi:energy-coupling factor transporter ATP-binding protein EcfA2
MNVPTEAAPKKRSGRPLVALVGNPNTGKSTLFNRLTGLRQHIANYPGITVEKKSGLLRAGGIETRTATIDTGGSVSVEVEVAEPAGSLEGIAVDRLGKPTPAAQVLIWRAGSGQARMVLADGLGEWRLAGLAPGDYRLLSVEMLETDADPAWLLRQESLAERVELREGARAGRLLLTRPAP